MSLCIQKTTLRISAGFAKQFPRDPIPQIAFSGRSNVGKSSLINTLLNRKNLARVSSSPGKTITVNFYDVDKKLFLVDMPGYGYAKRSPQEKQKWSELTDGYFRNNPNRDLLKLVVQLIDCKAGPTEDDLMMLNWLNANSIPYLIVATKIDKLNRTELRQNLDELCRSKFLNKDTVIVPFSSHTNEGRDILWGEIAAAAGIKL